MIKKSMPSESPIIKIIDDACWKFISTIKPSGDYEPSDLFKLASCITYGMHRSRVWYSKKTEQKTTLMIKPISTEEITQQTGIVFSGLSHAHMRICKKCHPSDLAENNQRSVINNILIDLIDHMAVVMVQKSLHESSKHALSTVKALDSGGFHVDDPILQSEILPAIYSTESYDQKKVFREVLLEYKRFMNQHNPYSVRTTSISGHIDLLLKKRQKTCTSLAVFNEDYLKPFGPEMSQTYFIDFLRDRTKNRCYCIRVQNKFALSGSQFDGHGKVMGTYVDSPDSPTSVSEIKEEAEGCIYSLFNHKMILDEPTLQWLRSGAQQDYCLR